MNANVKPAVTVAKKSALAPISPEYVGSLTGVAARTARNLIALGLLSVAGPVPEEGATTWTPAPVFSFAA